MRMILKNSLIEFGYEIVAEASNGLEALTLYSELKPDLVTLDITMPEMDGLTALKEIKTMDGCQSHHGVGDGAAGAFDSCGFYGAIDFIVKPFSKDRVREALLKAFAG